jgi:hypothetical protein
VILTPPTLLASIYGMTPRHMPEIEWYCGYPVALILMLLVAIGPILFLKRKDWLQTLVPLAGASDPGVHLRDRFWIKHMAGQTAWVPFARPCTALGTWRSPGQCPSKLFLKSSTDCSTSPTLSCSLSGDLL